MKMENKQNWTKFEELLQPSTKLRKLQGYGRRQLPDQSEITWEFCP